MRFNILNKMLLVLASLSLGIGGVPHAMAQVTQIDPNDAIDADLGDPGQNSGYNYNQDVAAPNGQASAPDNAYSQPDTTPYANGAQPPANATPQLGYDPAQGQDAVTQGSDSQAPTGSYQRDDLIGAAEGVFGKGAEGLAGLIEDILSDQGEPNGYIVGREASGAFVVGLRYGSGTLHHKVEGQKPAYWTGPSVGFDAGANAGNTFILVYNLYDSEDLYKRFPAGEGAAYLVGGFHTSYLRSGDVVLIPVRLGLGLRLGVNAGYMKFSKKRKLLPF